LKARGDRGREALHGVSFEVRRGEILGVAGVAGNGQRELTQVLTGLRPPSAGRVTLSGRPITHLGAAARFDLGVAHIPEDRNHMGVVGGMSVSENLMLRGYRRTKGPLLDERGARRRAEAAISTYRIAAPSPDTPVRLLSGGNVQKVILARELEGEPALIVAAHPTYGLDVSAAEQTRALLLAQRARGAGVLLVSEDLDELLDLSDRILVLFAGKVAGTAAAERAARDALGLMMAGAA